MEVVENYEIRILRYLYDPFLKLLDSEVTVLSIICFGGRGSVTSHLAWTSSSNSPKTDWAIPEPSKPYMRAAPRLFSHRLSSGYLS